MAMRRKVLRCFAALTVPLVLGVAPMQLAAECDDTATSSSGMLEGELISGICVTVDIKLVSCTSCSCHYMGYHVKTGMRMSFVTGGTSCGLSLPISVVFH